MARCTSQTALEMILSAATYISLLYYEITVFRELYSNDLKCVGTTCKVHIFV